MQDVFQAPWHSLSAGQGTRLAELDDAAGNALARIAGRLGFQVVWIGMHDQTLADDAVGRILGERGVGQSHLQAGLAACVGDDVAEVTGVMIRMCRIAVLLAGRIEVAAGAGSVGRAAVALLMDVEAMLSGRQPFDAGVHQH